MARYLIGWLLAASHATAAIGCNQVYDLEPTESLSEADADNDGRIDLDDNCIDTPNADQSDFDRDEVGDACDNCPLSPNTPQQNVGESVSDRDAIGDDCDPNPTRAGDCLILIDRFTDPTRLAADWELVHRAADSAPTLQHAGDHVVFQPVTRNSAVFMVARVDATRLVGRFSVSVVGDWDPPSDFAEAMAAADVVSVDSHLACGVQKLSSDAASAYLRFQVTPTQSQIQGGFLSGPPVRSDLLVRLAVERNAMDVGRCSVRWGVADGVTNTPNALAPLPVGGAGVAAINDPVAIRAIALYETRATCPTTILR